MKQHIDYIDLLKGFSIFGVVWLHSVGSPNWLTSTIVNSTFFFLSGIFFKIDNFSNFIKKKTKTLMLPFIVFYVLSYIFRILLHLWDYRTLANFDWSCIFELFEISERSDYLLINLYLWFILCLFIVQIIYYFVSKLNKYVITILILITIFCSELINAIPSPFMINNAFFWFGYFAAGNLLGKFLIVKMQTIKNRILLFSICVIGISLLSILNNNYLQTEYATSVIYLFKMYFIFGLMFSIGSFFDGWAIFKPIRFLGTNTLAILCMQDPILIILHRVANKYLIYEANAYTGLFHALLTCLILYVPIVLCNRYCPIIVGKSRKVKSTNDIQTPQPAK